MCRRSEHRTLRTEAKSTGHPFGYTPAMGRVLEELLRNDMFTHQQSTEHSVGPRHYCRYSYKKIRQSLNTVVKSATYNLRTEF